MNLKKKKKTTPGILVHTCKRGRDKKTAANLSGAWCA